MNLLKNAMPMEGLKHTENQLQMLKGVPLQDSWLISCSMSVSVLVKGIL